VFGAAVEFYLPPYRPGDHRPITPPPADRRHPVWAFRCRRTGRRGSWVPHTRSLVIDRPYGLPVDDLFQAVTLFAARVARLDPPRYRPV
jgi:hypothetical protein